MPCSELTFSRGDHAGAVLRPCQMLYRIQMSNVLAERAGRFIVCDLEEFRRQKVIGHIGWQGAIAGTALKLHLPTDSWQIFDDIDVFVWRGSRSLAWCLSDSCTSWRCPRRFAVLLLMLRVDDDRRRGCLHRRRVVRAAAARPSPATPWDAPTGTTKILRDLAKHGRHAAICNGCVRCSSYVRCNAFLVRCPQQHFRVLGRKTNSILFTASHIIIWIIIRYLLYIVDVSIDHLP